MQIEYYNPRTETMPRKELDELIMKRARNILRWGWEHSPLYRKKLKEAGLTPEDIRNYDDWWRKIPTTDKQDLFYDQNQNPPFGTRSDIPPNKCSTVWLTSGTSGRGQEVHTLTEYESEFNAPVWSTGFYWQGVRPGDVVAHTWPIGLLAGGLSAEKGFEGLMTNLFRLVPLYDTKTRLELMKQFRSSFLLTIPTQLLRMVAMANELGIDLKRDIGVKGCCVATEAYPIEFVKRMEDAWGFKLHEMWGATQSNPGVLFTCEYGALREDGSRGMLHLVEGFSLMEVVDRETREPVSPGEEGELVVTNLVRKATPIIRFAMNDKVKFLSYDYCPCGRTYNGLESGTIVRYDDMIKIKGVNFWPKTADEVILSFPEIAEYSGVVKVDEKTGLEKAGFILEFGAQLPENTKKEVRQKILEEMYMRTGLHWEIFGEAPTGTLPRFEFKARRWLDERYQKMVKGI